MTIITGFQICIFWGVGSEVTIFTETHIPSNGGKVTHFWGAGLSAALLLDFGIPYLLI